MSQLSNESMASPELLLPALNQALRSLYGAMDVLGEGAHDLEGELLDLMRRFHLAEVLGAYSVVAVAGSQGAGKSTLLRGLYDLGGGAGAWLPTNEGTGEKVPVLILEEVGRSQPQGFIRRLSTQHERPGIVKTEDVEATPEEFRAACSGENVHALLPVLKVPSLYFKRAGAAWLLLPGYEQLDDVNQGWQDLMRQGFIGSTFFLVVTDASRLASGVQDKLLQDIQSGALKGVAPVVVVTKTEQMAADPKKLEELRRSAADMFGLDAAQADRRIVCTGPAGDDAYKAIWKPMLAALLQEMSAGGADHRRDQIQQLERVVRNDLRRTLGRIKSAASVFLQAGSAIDAGGAAALKDCLEAFDSARDGLSKEFESGMKTLLNSHTSKAWNDLQKSLINNREGVKNKVRNLFQTASEEELAMQEDVLQAWARAGAVLDGFVGQLQRVTADALGGPSVETKPSDETNTLAFSDAPNRSIAVRLEELAYVDKTGHSMPWKEPSEDTLRELRRIFGKDRTNTGPNLRQAIALLPAITLEHARAATLLLPELALSSEQPERLPMADVQASLGKLKQSAAEAQDFSKIIVAGITAFVSTDIAEDGALNLFGTVGTGAGGAAVAANPYVLALVALGAIGYITHQAFSEARQFDYTVRSYAHGMLLGIKDSHHAHFMSRFDDLMDRMRERLRACLSVRYGLDEMLMKQDRLAKALADVDSSRRAMLDELGESGAALELFASTRT